MRTQSDRRMTAMHEDEGGGSCFSCTVWGVQSSTVAGSAPTSEDWRVIPSKMILSVVSVVSRQNIH